MLIYFALITLWALGYVYAGERFRRGSPESLKWYAIYAGVLLTLVMGLKHWTVGSDWAQYLYHYESIASSITFDEILAANRPGYWGFFKFLRFMGLGDQAVIFLVGLILSCGFVYFFYHHSNDLFLSLFLHLTIGLFTMSMSGIRQSLAIVICLMAYILLDKKKFVAAAALVVVAFSLHSSSIAFLAAFFISHMRLGAKGAFALWCVTASSIFYRVALTGIVNCLAPEEYLGKYDIITTANQINPALVVIGLAIPLFCLICKMWLKELDTSKNKAFGPFFIMTCVSAFCIIMSLNSNIIGRVGYYFTSFAMVLLSNTVSGIADKKSKTLVYMFALLFPMIQFAMSTPGGTLRIDDYLFFWQGVPF